jgi:carbon storage regulator
VLVLTRKSNQSIMIGDDVEISVLSIMGEKVRIGIAAPRDVPVFRKEVYLEIQAERGQVTPPGSVVHDGDGHSPAGAVQAVDEALGRLASS